MAAPEPTNPYAAPSDIGADAHPVGHLWQVEGVGVLVSDGAVLPKIDLETGNEDPSLIEVKRKFMKGHWSLGFMGLGPPLFQFLPKSSRRLEGIPFWIPLVIFFGVWLAVYGTIFFTLTRWATFSTYTHPEREARRKRNRRIQLVLLLPSLSLLIVPLILVLTHRMAFHYATLITGVILGVVGMLAIALWQYRDRPKIQMKLQPNGWLRLGGVHFNAIRRMEEWESRI